MRVGDHLRLKVGLLFTEDSIRNKEDGSSKHQAGEEPIVGRAFELWLTTSVGSFGNRRVGFLSLFCDPEKFPSFFVVYIVCVQFSGLSALVKPCK